MKMKKHSKNLCVSLCLSQKVKHNTSRTEVVHQRGGGREHRQSNCSKIQREIKKLLTRSSQRKQGERTPQFSGLLIRQWMLHLEKLLYHRLMQNSIKVVILRKFNSINTDLGLVICYNEPCTLSFLAGWFSSCAMPFFKLLVCKSVPS